MAKAVRLNPPERLTDNHDLSGFVSGEPSLDEWLQKRAWRNEREGGSRTFVISVDKRVIGYYSLATGSIWRAQATGRVKRNMPDPIPVMLIGRLAIDREFQGDGLGRELLADAVRRTLAAADIAGIRAIMVQAISADAKLFYRRCGFVSSPVSPMTMMITVQDAIAALGDD